MFTDLLKTEAKQALKATAMTELDVLEDKRSLKNTFKTHGIQAAENTSALV